MRRHLLVIGAQRCGTTYLQGRLDAHPDITMARPSRPEPKVFLSDEESARGLDWYEQTYFGHARTESVLGAKTTSYLEYADAAPRARSALGEAEVVAVLRDPVSRAVSNWRFSTQRGMEQEPLADALGANLRAPLEWDPERSSVSPRAYLERGRYVDYLLPWLEVFPKLHVYFFEELTKQALATCAKMYADLGVDDQVRPSGDGVPVNASVASEDEPPEELRTQLRDYFLDSDRRLETLLGRSLPWPSDRSSAVNGAST